MSFHISAGDANRTLASVEAQLRNLVSAGHAEEVAAWIASLGDVAASAPPPVLDAINPTSGQSLGADVEIVCTGSGFTSRSKIYFNGGAENTTFVSETEVKTMFKASTAEHPGGYGVKVVTSPPGGGSSAELVFTVTPASEAGRRGGGGLRTGRRA